MSVRPACAVVILSVAFALAGCSRSESDDQAPATGEGSNGASVGVGETFATQAVEVCDQALEDKQGWASFPVADFDPSAPDGSDFPEVAAWLEDEVAPTFQSWLDGLEGLGEPPSGQDAWGDVLASVEQIGQLNTDQIMAADDDDPEAFASATADLETTQVDLVAATEAAGVPECAEVHAA
jgi:hypothetical protein